MSGRPASTAVCANAAAVASSVGAVSASRGVVDETVAPFERWLAFPDGKLAALHAAAPLVAGLPSGQVARQVVRVARQLGLSYAEVTDALTGVLRAQE